jgi:hypothetical protein
MPRAPNSRKGLGQDPGTEQHGTRGQAQLRLLLLLLLLLLLAATATWHLALPTYEGGGEAPVAHAHVLDVLCLACCLL